LTRFRIASIRQFPVTMNGLVAAPVQFCADRRFAGAGNAFDQIISDAIQKPPYSLARCASGLSLGDENIATDIAPIGFATRSTSGAEPSSGSPRPIVGSPTQLGR
jgi:hypothetical protein